MASNQYDFDIENPLDHWDDALSFDSKEFLMNLSKAALKIASADAFGAAEHLISTFGSAQPTERKLPPPMLAWKLISISLYKGIYFVLSENNDFIETTTAPTDVRDLEKLIDKILSHTNIGFSRDFFDDPRNQPLFKNLERPLKDWFLCLGITADVNNLLFEALKSRFIIELHNELTSAPTTYSSLEASVTSSVSPALKKERKWSEYNTYLQECASHPVFTEAFTIRDVYIPLRAYYTSQSKQYVVDAYTQIKQWISSPVKQDPIKGISGGPGSGKSSFSKILAADISRQMPHIKVVHIPLHLLDYQSNLANAISSFNSIDKHIPENPCSITNSQVLLILDGFDELDTVKSPQEFLSDLERTCRTKNRHKALFQIILTSRPTSFDSKEFHLEESKKLHLLPYFVDKTTATNEYTDINGLLNEDQRDSWWVKYGDIINEKYAGMPESLKNTQFNSLTAEPLLNYLFALSYRSGSIRPLETTNLNDVYEDLLASVYRREWDEDIHLNARALSQEHFFEVLENISLAMWHAGHSRTAKLNDLNHYMNEDDLNLLDLLDSSKTSSGIMKLLTTFYFRINQANNNSEHMLEFTHKSFGEYLVARRVSRELLSLSKKFESFNNIEALAVSWVSFFKNAKIDMYINNFLIYELNKLSQSELCNIHICVKELVLLSIYNGISFEKVGIEKYNDMKSTEKSTNLLLLDLLCCMSALTKETTNSYISDSMTYIPEEFSEWFTKVRVNQPSKSLSLNHIELKDINFDDQYFYFDSISYSNFDNCSLQNLGLSDSYISHSDISKTSLEFSNFHNSIFEHCKLYSCDFSNSIFDFFKVSDCNFYDCKFNNSIMSLIDLSATIMTDCKFINCNLNKTNFKHSVFSNTSFQNSDLRDADFTGASLNNVDFSGAYLIGATFSGATLKKIMFDENTLWSASHLEMFTQEQRELYNSFTKNHIAVKQAKVPEREKVLTELFNK